MHTLFRTKDKLSAVNKCLFRGSNGVQEAVRDFGALILFQDLDEGRRGFLDEQRMYNQEKRKLMRREAQEKAPDEDVAGERDGHWKDQDHLLHGIPARREMR